MKRLGAHLAYLRRSLLFLGAAIALGATASYLTHGVAARAAHAHEEALLRQAELHSLQSRQEGERTGTEQDIARYAELAGRGIVGPERRLDWVERIAQISRQRRLLDLRYEFAPQKPLATPNGATSAAPVVAVSTMKLRLALLHEEDLLGLLRDLARDAPALTRVRNCSVERRTDSADDAYAARLRADCTIDWITLREPA